MAEITSQQEWPLPQIVWFSPLHGMYNPAMTNCLSTSQLPLTGMVFQRHLMHSWSQDFTLSECIWYFVNFHISSFVILYKNEICIRMTLSLKNVLLRNSAFQKVCPLEKNVGFFKVGSKSITSLMLNFADMSVICQNGVPFMLLNEHFHFPGERSAVHPYNVEHCFQAIYISTASIQWTCFTGSHKSTDAFK